MPINKKLSFFEVMVDNLTLSELNEYVSKKISSGEKAAVGYVTANSLNVIYDNVENKKLFNCFDVIHPDGSGLFLASKFLYGKTGFQKKVTGSDYYPLLINEAIKNQWSIFFFGDTNKTLELLKINSYRLCISGYQNGYNFDNNELINKINLSSPDILIVGLGCPKQERWIFENKDKLKVKLILAVGDGIKVFTGTKVRGFPFLRKIGLEWLIRLINHPVMYWKRYILGIPLFIYRIIKLKYQDQKL